MGIYTKFNQCKKQSRRMDFLNIEKVSESRKNSHTIGVFESPTSKLECESCDYKQPQLRVLEKALKEKSIFYEEDREIRQVEIVELKIERKELKKENESSQEEKREFENKKRELENEKYKLISEKLDLQDLNLDLVDENNSLKEENNELREQLRDLFLIELGDRRD